MYCPTRADIWCCSPAVFSVSQAERRVSDVMYRGTSQGKVTQERCATVIRLLTLKMCHLLIQWANLSMSTPFHTHRQTYTPLLDPRNFIQAFENTPPMNFKCG